MLQINLVFLFWIRWWIISSIPIFFIWWTMETEINSLTDDVANRISLGFWNRDQHRRGVSEILFAKKKKKLKFYFHRPGFFFVCDMTPSIVTDADVDLDVDVLARWLVGPILFFFCVCVFASPFDLIVAFVFIFYFLACLCLFFLFAF